MDVSVGTFRVHVFAHGTGVNHMGDGVPASDSGSAPLTRTLGVNIVAGVAFLALVDSSGRYYPAEADRITPTVSLAAAGRLREFCDRVEQEINRLKVVTLAVAHPKKYGNWTYHDAFVRVSLEAAIMLASEHARIRYVSVRHDGQAARCAGVALNEISAGLLSRATRPTPSYWNDRSVALFAALAASNGYA